MEIKNNYMNTSKLKQLLKDRGITNQKLAKLSNVTDVTIGNLLKGNDPKLSTIQAIADALEVPITYFFDDSTNYNNSFNGNNSINASGRNYTISGNNLNGKVCVNLPPKGYQTVVNSEGETNYISSSTDDLQTILIERDKLRNEVLELHRIIRSLQNNNNTQL